ncbi:MAG TPA: nuclear transport factor 2 family protein [Terriglobales bacterium]|nr:nuclear transport factor 2 family protein [Terriglobales bacterium]
MIANTELLQHLYERFNTRDMESLLEAMHRDVVWANGMEGGYVTGHEGVRGYWTRQWAMIDPLVEPVAFSTRAEGTTEVEVHQIVRDLKGNVLSDKIVRHVFHIEDGLIKRFDIQTEPLPPNASDAAGFGGEVDRHR